MRCLRIITGICIWIPVVSGLSWQFRHNLIRQGVSESDVASQLWQFATGQRSGVELQADRDLLVANGDPIFLVTHDNHFQQVGEIRSVPSVDEHGRRVVQRTRTSRALLYPAARISPADVELVYHSSPGTMEWILKTVLPPEKQRQIAAVIASAVDAHQGEIVAAFTPIVKTSLQDAIEIVQEDIGPVIERHRGEIADLAEMYQREFSDEDLMPLVREEIWPIVREHAEPTATEIGRHIWQRASVWRFAWRYLYDKSPLPQRDHLSTEWQRFLEQEAIPELQTHVDKIVETVQHIVTDASRNPQVRDSLRLHVTRVAEDEELHRLVWKIVREAVVDNPRLREAVEARMKGAQARRVFRLAGARLEPFVRRIGDLLFGTHEEGITPEFASILRNQILGKDRRWFLMRPRRLAAQPAGLRPSAVPVYVTDSHRPHPVIGLVPQGAKAEGHDGEGR